MANQSEKKHILKSNGQNKPFIGGPLKHEIFLIKISWKWTVYRLTDWTWNLFKKSIENKLLICEPIKHKVLKVTRNSSHVDD